MSFSKKLARFALSGALAMSMVLPNSLAVFQAKVNADSLYLRQSPGGAVITTLSKGTTVAVLNNSSSWYKVSVNGKEGYVSGEYLTGTTATDVALGTGTVKCSSSVNFRSAPNTSSTSYGELKNSTKVNVVGVSSGAGTRLHTMARPAISIRIISRSQAAPPAPPSLRRTPLPLRPAPPVR